MTVGALQDFKRHSEIPSCLSWLRFPQPSAKSPLCVAGILRTKPASLTALLNAVFDWRNRLAVELKEVFRDQCGADAASGRAIVKGLGLPLAAYWSSRAEACLPCRCGIALAFVQCEASLLNSLPAFFNKWVRRTDWPAQSARDNDVVGHSKRF